MCISGNATNNILTIFFFFFAVHSGRSILSGFCKSFLNIIGRLRSRVGVMSVLVFSHFQEYVYLYYLTENG